MASKPPTPTWTYDPRSDRYKNSLMRFVSKDDVMLWAWEVADRTGDKVMSFAEQMGNRNLRLSEWQTLMRQEIKDEYIRQYLAGKGGVGNMTQRDYGIIGRALKDQWAFLDNFAAEIKAGRYGPPEDLSFGAIATRARMYITSGHEMFERAKAEALGMPMMPATPADGSTICLTRDRCHWRYVKKDDGSGWDAYWELEPGAEHCDTCINRAAHWNPLFVPAGMSKKQADAWRIAKRNEAAAIGAGGEEHSTSDPNSIQSTAHHHEHY